MIPGLTEDNLRVGMLVLGAVLLIHYTWQIARRSA